MFRLSGGGVHVRLTAAEADFLAVIPALLASIGSESSDPGYEVLHRPIYRDDARADSDLAAVVFEEEEAQRTLDRRVVGRVAGGGSSMTLDEARGFLRTINEARLVLAARAGAFDDSPGWEDRIVNKPVLANVAWLGHVQAELIRVLATP